MKAVIHIKYIKSMILLLIGVSFLHCEANPKKIEGAWEGKLNISGTEVRIIFLISHNGNDMLVSTMNSPDQGIEGIPVSNTSFKNGTIQLDVSSIGAFFNGKLNESNIIITGNWFQGGHILPLKLERTKVKTFNQPNLEEQFSRRDRERVQGIWEGILRVSGAELRLIFRFASESDEDIIGTMDSPDQGATRIPIKIKELSENILKIDIKSIGGLFEGEFKEEYQVVVGRWTQMGNSWPLVLSKVNKVDAFKRTQIPKKPYPYDEENVLIENKDNGINLAGTLTLPRLATSFPAVLLISGSGPHDRDATMFGHRPFLVIADHLTRQGIAVLRIDDRGVGQSTGDLFSTTSENFISDVLAEVEYLKNHPNINSRLIGLIGHSEGGLIAPMVAAQSSDIAYIVLMAAPGIRGEELLYMQSSLMLKKGGMSLDIFKSDRRYSEQLYALIKKEKDIKIIVQKAKKINTEIWKNLNKESKEQLYRLGYSENTLKQQLSILTSPWFRFFLTYDPAITLKKNICPVLAINGDKDLQIPSKMNLNAIEAALKSGQNSQYKVMEIPGLNHLFQSAITGLPSEYSRIEETISPVVMKVISDWIKITIVDL